MPDRGIRLVLVGGDGERVLGTVDGFYFEHEVAIPPDTPPGEATIKARTGDNSTGGWPAPFRITDSEPVEPRPGQVAQPQLPALGYVLAASDGGVFAFGARRFRGSAAGLDLNAPVIGIASSPLDGYWLGASDGGVFAFGSAEFRGAAEHDYGCGPSVVGPVTGIAAQPASPGAYPGVRPGYWATTRRGYVFGIGAGFYGAAFPFEYSEVDHGAAVALAAHPGG
ncbi:MAG: hypothetical protein M3394_02495, partial [Actinomycetota bacterium]|nr:hypothetical protein [Actinomycetota bacterium]